MVAHVAVRHRGARKEIFTTFRKTPPVLFASVAILLSPVTTIAQLSCDDAVQDHLEGNFGFANKTVADTEIAVGMDRMLTCSNLFLHLLNKSGEIVSPGPAKLGNYTNHPTLSAFMFPVAGNPGSNDQVNIGDPMVYYDYENERFWVVAVEVHSQHSPVPQRVHIAVCASGAPTSWEAIGQSEPNGWYKYHYCLWRIDEQCLNTKGVGHNQTIYVDGDTLYIAFLDDEGTDKTTTLMMVDKDDLMAGTQATPQFIKLADSPYNEDTWGHAVAVEYDAWDNDDPVYTIASGNKPHFPAQLQDTIIVGAIVKSGSTFSYVSHSITTSEGLPPWYDNAGASAAPSGSGAVTVIGRPFLHATYRHDGEVGGRIWACAHIRDVDGQSPVGGNFVRYFEIHTNGWPNSTSVPTLGTPATLHSRVARRMIRASRSVPPATLA